MNNKEEGCHSFEAWICKLGPELLFGKLSRCKEKVPDGLEPEGKQEEEEAEDSDESTSEANRLFEWLSRRQALA